MNQEDNKEALPAFKEECGTLISIDPPMRIMINPEHYVVLQGPQSETGETTNILLGKDPEVLIRLVGYLTHLIIDHHGIDLEAAMTEAQRQAEFAEALPTDHQVH